MRKQVIDRITNITERLDNLIEQIKHFSDGREKHEHWCVECSNIFYRNTDYPCACPECDSLNVIIDYEKKEVTNENKAK